MKAHAFGDWNELNLEPYVTLRALPASSLGSYPTLKLKIRIQYQCTEAGPAHLCLGSLPSYSDAKMIPNQARPTVTPWKVIKEIGWPEQGPTLTPQRVGVPAASSSSLTQPFIHATELSSSLRYRNSTRTVTSDLVITKPLISLSAPKSLFGIWQSDQFDGLNILTSLSRALWHYHLDCPPSVTILWQKSFSSILKWEAPT